MKKYAAYCRVSTDNSDQENSFLNQSNYFKQKLGEDVLIFADQGLTGTSFNRPQFLDMLQKAGLDILDVSNKKVFVASNREPLFNYIYVTNTSRFARNILVISIIRELKKKGVYIVFEDLGKTTENPADELLINMLMTLDEQFSRDLSAKVRKGVKRSAERTDKIHSNKKIFGYKYENNELKVIPEEAEIIELIFSLYLKGDGSRIITKKINELGYKTRLGNPFSDSSVLEILKNSKYAGLNDRRKWTCQSLEGDKKRERADTTNIKFKESEKIEAIVSLDDYTKVQKMLRERSPHKIGVNVGKTEWNGKVKCGYCGANMVRTSNKINTYFICSNKKKNGYATCPSKMINELLLISRLNEFRAHKNSIIVSTLNRCIKAVDERIRSTTATLNSISKAELVENAKNSIKSIEQKKQKLLDLYLEQEIDKETYRQRKEKLDLEINDFNNIIISKGNMEASIENTMLKGLNKFKSKLPVFVEKFKNDKGDIMEYLNLISKITIKDSDNITFETTADEAIKATNQFLNQI